MREEIPDASVDLIYLDPPFNSKRIYNASMGGAQWEAFNDTWQWHEAIEDFHEVASDPDLAPVMEGLRTILGESPNLAYLSYMANRLRECHRVLKDTGSIYLHCDPTMSHYLKVVMDGVFGRNKFRNEIVWKRTSSHNDAKVLGSVHDIVFQYSKSSTYIYNRQYVPYDEGYIERRYRNADEDGRKWMDDNLSAKGLSGGGYEYEYRGVSSLWRVPLSRMKELDITGRLHFTSRGGIRIKRYLDEMKGLPLSDVWTDISPVNSQARERLGYPTQKPVALLERIIKANSDVGHVVLDPFCGCGTTIHAAQNLDRQWIGIDVCVKACQVIEHRIQQHFDSLWSDVEYVGFPKTADDAKELAHLDKFKFEKWAVSLTPYMEANKKQRGDGGIDGRGRLAIRKGQFIDLVSQAKGGNTSPGDVQAFNGARQQVKADLGIFTCFQDKVTTGMRNVAVNAGRFMDVPTIQIYTVEDFFENRLPQFPR